MEENCASMNNILTYGKVNLRPLEPDDLDLLYEWENNMDIWEVSNTKTPYSKHILAQYLVESANDIYTTKQLRLVIQNEQNQAVGAVDLFDFDPYHLRAGIGILVHDDKNRRHGYAEDALQALSAYALEVLGLKQLYANISEDNEGSIRLFTKTGFTQSCIKKDWLKTINGWKDELFFQKMLSK